MNDLYVDFNIMRKGEEVMPDGTTFQTKLTASYHQLVDVFGYPEDFSKWNGLTDYKVEHEWTFEFVDRTVATIYNWKNGVRYAGLKGIPLEEMTEWHIGGHDLNAVRWIVESMRLKFNWNLKQLENVGRQL